MENLSKEQQIHETLKIFSVTRLGEFPPNVYFEYIPSCFKVAENNPNYWATFFPLKICTLIGTKNGFGHFCAIFSQAHLVTLYLTNDICSKQ
jgi:hypothetical protein